MKRKIIGIFVCMLLIATALSAVGTTKASNNNLIKDRSVSSLPSDDWPMFHHDVRHTGYTTESGPNKGNLIWKFQTGDDVHSSPAIADGNGDGIYEVYIGSNDNKVYCLNANDGTQIWSYTTGGDVISSPAVANGHVYVGSDDFLVYCLDASTGSFKWSYQTGGYVRSSPIVAGGYIYVGSSDNYEYCLTDNPVNHLIWKDNLYGTVGASPSYADGFPDGGDGIYDIYTGSDVASMWCMNSLTGALQCSDSLGINIVTTAAMGNGCNHNGADLEEYVGAGNSVFCIDSTGGLGDMWIFPTTGGNIESSPAFGDCGNGSYETFFGSNDKNVYCVNANGGSKIWSYTTGDEVRSSPAVADGMVYIGSRDGKVYCLNAITGVKIWDYQTGDDVFSSPAVYDTKVYVGSNDNYVYCFGEHGGPDLIIHDRSAGGTPILIGDNIYEQPFWSVPGAITQNGKWFSRFSGIVYRYYLCWIELQNDNPGAALSGYTIDVQYLAGSGTTSLFPTVGWLFYAGNPPMPIPSSVPGSTSTGVSIPPLSQSWLILIVATPFWNAANLQIGVHVLSGWGSEDSVIFDPV